MKKEFEMSEGQLAKLMDASKPVPMMALQCGTPISPQENANDAWRALGEELGFNYMTVEPVSGKSDRFFMAEPTAIEEESSSSIEDVSTTMSGIIGSFDSSIRPKPEKSSRAINIIFDGPPSHESGRFVEVENDRGQSVSVGEWEEREDGLWALRITKLLD